MAEQNLKPCPFCGSSEVEVKSKIDTDGFWFVECCCCYASSGWWMDKNTAILRWNVRHVGEAENGKF